MPLYTHTLPVRDILVYSTTVILYLYCYIPPPSSVIFSLLLLVASGLEVCVCPLVCVFVRKITQICEFICTL